MSLYQNIPFIPFYHFAIIAYMSIEIEYSMHTKEWDLSNQ